jgi:hypothetical protein
VLERLYSTCYQASHLSEEGRPVTFRAILAEVDAVPSHGGPPRDLHRLEFARTVPFEPRELRRLTQAADFARSLIGVRADAAGRLSIWGLIHQGPRWLQDVVGGRGGRATLPPVPVVHVVAPGSVEARCGPELVGRLEPGKLSGTRFDVFEARWPLGRFSTSRTSSGGSTRVRGNAEKRWASSGRRSIPTCRGASASES